MNYQWYPGHMTKAKRMMQEDIRLIDLVIELVDARVPLSSRNPDIDALANGKSRIVLLNKADLADAAVTDRWKEYFEEQGSFAAALDSRNKGGLRQIRPLIEEACAKKRERDRKRGILNRPVRAMVCGIPNVGKSTLINSLAGRSSARTGNRPGVTRGKQWIRVSAQLELLDTPGVLWPKFEDPMVGVRLALIGSIREEILDAQELAFHLIWFLTQEHPGLLEDKYGLQKQAFEAADEGKAAEAENIRERERLAAGMLGQIALSRGCLRREMEPDTDRAAALLLDDFRKAKLGKISLEFPGPTP